MVESAWLGSAVDWLVDHAGENLGTEIVVRAIIAGSERWQVATAGRGRRTTGVAVWAHEGQWFLEADGESSAIELAEAVEASGSRPTKVTASGTVKAWLRPRLVAVRTIRREHDLLAMVCRAPPLKGDGRWATPDDRRALERYQAAYNEERGTTTEPDWVALTSRPAVAVAEHEDRIAAVVKRGADTGRYATIGGTWTDPDLRRRGFATLLTGYVVAALLTERPAVHLVVDDDNTEAISLYRSLGFDEVGRCYMAYLCD